MGTSIYYTIYDSIGLAVSSRVIRCASRLRARQRVHIECNNYEQLVCGEGTKYVHTETHGSHLAAQKRSTESRCKKTTYNQSREARMHLM